MFHSVKYIRPWSHAATIAQPVIAFRRGRAAGGTVVRTRRVRWGVAGVLTVLLALATSGLARADTVVRGGLNPSGVAVDRAGDVFIADPGDSEVVEDTPDGSGGYVQSVVDSGLSAPQGVAVDRAGDVFIADPGDSEVVEDTPDGSGGYVQSVVDSGLSAPQGAWRSIGPGMCSLLTLVTARWWRTRPTAAAATSRAWLTLVSALLRAWRSIGPGMCSLLTPVTARWWRTRNRRQRRLRPERG